jgi:hypothetical protein
LISSQSPSSDTFCRPFVGSIIRFSQFYSSNFLLLPKHSFFGDTLAAHPDCAPTLSPPLFPSYTHIHIYFRLTHSLLGLRLGNDFGRRLANYRDFGHVFTLNLARNHLSSNSATCLANVILNDKFRNLRFLECVHPHFYLTILSHYFISLFYPDMFTLLCTAAGNFSVMGVCPMIL